MNLTPELIRFIQRTGMALQAYLPRAAAEVFALLVVADEALSTDEIACALKLSRTGVQSSLRVLDAHEVVVRSARPGERRDRYSLCEDPFARILGRVSRQFRELAEIAHETASDAPRLDEMTTTFERASASLDAWRHS